MSRVEEIREQIAKLKNELEEARKEERIRNRNKLIELGKKSIGKAYKSEYNDSCVCYRFAYDAPDEDDDRVVITVYSWSDDRSRDDIYTSHYTLEDIGRDINDNKTTECDEQEFIGAMERAIKQLVGDRYGESVRLHKCD